MPYVQTEIDIAAPRKVIYELAKDMERYSEFMPDVEYVKIVRRDGAKTVTRWKTLVEDAPIEWTEEDIFDDERTRIDYRLIEGDLDKFEGAWTFEERDGMTHVVLGVDYDFGVPTLAELIGPILQKKVEENSLMMLRALKAKSEGPERSAG
jgi:ribosome-associated toxin RatA of RatAB toxin-antitoxin module